ncbi:DUF2398 family protein, partial [Nocardia wallacei]|uniref:DUF2398 family protein n=1 Tax=Nocardia wallacei TaxID=480035 RepID=UPI0024554B4A
RLPAQPPPARGGPAPPPRAPAARGGGRALVELPVVYAERLPEDERALLGTEKLVAEVELLTGLRAERRAEGVALIDVSGRFSDVRFPGTGTLAQVALLLIGEIADLVLDIDNPVPRRPLPPPDTALAAQLDAAIPASTVFTPLVVDSEPDAAEADSGRTAEETEIPEHPVVRLAWVRETVQALTERYGSTFAAQWQADAPGLTREVVALLERLHLVEVLDEELVVLPALARYRGAVVTVRTRAESELFASARKLGAHAQPEQGKGTA